MGPAQLWHQQERATSKGNDSRLILAQIPPADSQPSKNRFCEVGYIYGLLFQKKNCFLSIDDLNVLVSILVRGRRLEREKCIS